jgi:hypothetical protein
MSPLWGISSVELGNCLWSAMGIIPVAAIL